MSEKLMSMTDYILSIDWLTTKEFCDKYSVPLPVMGKDAKESARNFLQVDAIKHKMFVEYAKLLKKNTTPVVSSGYLCKNVNGEDAVIIAENIASAFDKLEDITPYPESVEMQGKSINLY
jgi:hypothetical protein